MKYRLGSLFEMVVKCLLFKNQMGQNLKEMTKKWECVEACDRDKWQSANFVICAKFVNLCLQ